MEDRRKASCTSPKEDIRIGETEGLLFDWKEEEMGVPVEETLSESCPDMHVPGRICRYSLVKRLIVLMFRRGLHAGRVFEDGVLYLGLVWHALQDLLEHRRETWYTEMVYPHIRVTCGITDLVILLRLRDNEPTFELVEKEERMIRYLYRTVPNILSEFDRLNMWVCKSPEIARDGCHNTHDK